MTGGEPVVPRPETPAQSPAQPAKAETPETPAATPPPAAQPAPEPPKGAEPLEEEEEPVSGSPKRVRIKNLQEADKGYLIAATKIAETEGIPFDDAWKRVTGQSSQPAQRQPETPPQPTEVEKLEGRQVEIEARLLELGDDPLNADEIRQLTREAGRNDGRLEALKVVTAHDAKLASEDAAIVKAEAINAALLNVQQKLHPDFGDENSALFAEARAIATNPNHPDYDPNRVTSPQTAWAVAKAAMFNLGIKPAPVEQNVPRGTLPVPQFVPPQPGSVVKPAAPTKGTVPAPPQLSAAEKAKRSQEIVSSVLEGGDAVPLTSPRQSGRFLIL
jgi:hypothetical protein